MKHKERFKKQFRETIWLLGFYPSLKYLQSLDNSEEYELCGLCLEVYEELELSKQFSTSLDSLENTLNDVLSTIPESSTIRANMWFYEKEFNLKMKSIK